MRSQGTSQFYRHTPHSAAAFSFPAKAGTHLPTPEGWKAELTLGGWLVTYQNKCPAPGIEPDTVAHLSNNQARRRLTSLIEANVLTAMPDHQTLPSNCFEQVVQTLLPLLQSTDDQSAWCCVTGKVTHGHSRKH